ncbi:hypothetical protein ABZ990_28515 [Streptomyces sp. NPDC046203]|uniref:hypothetical protein n=1 Tax=Streptomyces sp. NPDC046203 TaxID=3154602 RepID=UPI0033EB3177
MERAYDKAIEIGDWTLYQDESGSLVMSCGETSLVFSAEGRISCDRRDFIQDKDEVDIWHVNRNSTLNATISGSSGKPDQWKSWTYWKQGKPNRDSTVRIEKIKKS